MKGILENQNKTDNEKKLKIFYIGILSICVIAIIATIVLQTMGEEENLPGEGIQELKKLTDEQISEHKAEFNEIFQNKVNYAENNSYKITKLEEDKEIIYIGYQSNETQINDYDLKVNIPYININNETINEFNTQIKDIFEKKARSVLNTQGNNIIYTVDYSAYIQNNILSLVVRSTLKEGSNPQRDIIQTYNYDLTNKKKCTIDDMLEMKNITKKDANQKIKDEIKKVQENVEEFEKLGYTIYKRDYTSDIYNINNVTEYFMGKDNALYIIYAYGNENNTAERDIVVM